MASLSELERVKRRLREDTPFWAATCATILNERRQLVRLVPRPWQARTPETPAHVTPLDEALEKQRAAGVPMRAIILKARKLGFSTWVQCKFMQRITQRPNEYALSVAHLVQSSGALMDMANRMYERLPDEQELNLGFSIKPEKIGESQTRRDSRWMALGDKRRPTEASIYETMTAGSKGGGRAQTPSMIHASEAAHFEDPTFLIGLLNSLPKEPETIAILESTPNGFNDFHDRWQRAVAGAEDPETGGLYVPLFYGWQDNPRNQMSFSRNDGTDPDGALAAAARARFERTIGDEDGGGDPEELELIERFNLSLEQLRWRRVTISEECGGSIEYFHQEHPAYPEQAFIGSGTPVFPGILIARAISFAQSEPEPVEGVLRPVEWKEHSTKTGTVKIPQKVVWVPRADILPLDTEIWTAGATLKVWEHPVSEETRPPERQNEPDGQYVMSVDVAQGRSSTREDGDFSAIAVLDHVEHLQVASLVSRIDIHDLPLVAFLIGLYYNRAWLAPEVQGLGIGVVDALRLDLRYPRLYRRRRAGDDRRNDTREQLLGWSTDMRTKPLMEQTMGQAFKEGTHGMRDVATARQFTTYVETDRGKHEAQKGTHDDLVMAYMIATRVAFELKPRGHAGPGQRRFEPVDETTGY